MRLAFELRYLLSRPPWDTGISPPELMRFIHAHPPGAAIDLGCGTGTNSITLAKSGWKVLGIDFSALAIRRAARKSRRLNLDLEFVQGDVTRLENPAASFDFALDIGCFHALLPEGKSRYIQSLKRVLKPSATYLVYTWIDPDAGPGSRAPSEPLIREAFGQDFEISNAEYGTDRHHQSAWIEMRRRP